MAEKIDGYWFAASDRLPHGDNRQIVLGETHSLDGEIIICQRALHASRDPFDALEYIPGPYLYRVRCWGDVVEDHDKLGARHREYIAMHDSTNMLRRFAHEQALSVIHLWKPPPVVRRYLETGDETIRAAARAAAIAATDAATNAAAAAAAIAATNAATNAAAAAAAWAADAADAAVGAAMAATRKRFSELVAELFGGSAV